MSVSLRRLNRNDKAGNITIGRCVHMMERRAVAPVTGRIRLNQHPNLNFVEIRCTSCGTSFMTRSTADDAIVVDICSNCHPAYTGRERAVSTGGRIERFNRRRALAAATTP